MSWHVAFSCSLFSSLLLVAHVSATSCTAVGDTCSAAKQMNTKSANDDEVVQEAIREAVSTDAESINLLQARKGAVTAQIKEGGTTPIKAGKEEKKGHQSRKEKAGHHIGKGKKKARPGAFAGKKVTRPKVYTPDAEYAREVDSWVREVIDYYFQNITSNGYQWGEMIVNPPFINYITWMGCTKVPWYMYGSEIAVRGEYWTSVAEAACGNETYPDVCQAIVATIAASNYLQSNMPEGMGPVFMKASLMDGPYLPSPMGQRTWLNGTVSEMVDISTPTPTMEVYDANAVNQYAVCEIVTTVLTQRAKQAQSGTCSWTAILTALSRNAPVVALKTALELYWTGSQTKMQPKPCNYIYNFQPGMIPWPFNDSPYNPIGIEFMWTWSLISSYRQVALGTCDEKPNQLAYKGEDPQSEGARLRSGAQGVLGAGPTIWAANEMLDPVGKSFAALFNYDLCGTGLDDSDCYHFMTYQYYSPELQRLWAASDQATLDAVVASSPNLQRLQADWIKVVGPPGFEACAKEPCPNTTNAMFYRNMNLPSATEMMLEQACAYTEEGKAAIVSIDDSILNANIKNASYTQPFYPQPGKPFGSCNHIVYLEYCNPEMDEYRFWTWGMWKVLSKSAILGVPLSADVSLGFGGRSGTTFNTGMVCNFIIGDVTVGPGDVTA